MSDFWNVRGECENYMLLSGHKNVVTELHWTTDGTCVPFLPFVDQTMKASKLFSCFNFAIEYVVPFLRQAHL